MSGWRDFSKVEGLSAPPLVRKVFEDGSARLWGFVDRGLCRFEGDCCDGLKCLA